MGSSLAKRQADFEREILSLLTPEWTDRRESINPDHYNYQPDFLFLAASQTLSAVTENVVGRLVERRSQADVGSLAADLYFHPVDWQRKYEKGDGRRSALLQVLLVTLIRHPPPDLDARIEERLGRILKDVGFRERADGEPKYSHRLMHYPPRIEECCLLLLMLPPTPERLGLIARVVGGQFDVKGSYETYRSALMGLFPRLARRLFGNHMFSYDLFRDAVLHFPGFLEAAGSGYTVPYALNEEVRKDKAFVARTFSYCDQVAWETAGRVVQGDTRSIRYIHRLRGSQYLLLAASLYQDRRLKDLEYNFLPDSEHLESAVVHLAGASETTPADPGERALLVGKLRDFSPTALESLLPYAMHSRALLCEALGWGAAMPLVREIERATGLGTALPKWQTEGRSSPDPTHGVVDARAVRAAIAEAGRLARKVVGVFRGSKLNAGVVLTVVEAVGGWNEKRIREGVAKRNQIPVRAYGALPLSRGKEEVAERYRFYRDFLEGSKQFGMLRQTSEKAAAAAGLANLAKNAGYGTTTRLEWAMETQITDASGLLGRKWSIRDYEVGVLLLDGEPDLTVTRAGKIIKATPSEVRGDPAYAEIKDALKRARKQASRYRATLEEMMSEEEPMTADDITNLLSSPLARFILPHILLGTLEGQFGLLDPESRHLIALDGSPLAVPDELHVAHPHHLFRVGVLGAWQKEVVHRRIVQPFKQVFRELYIVTPAERETRSFSNRFAGHALDSGIASRLFQARGWHMEPGDVALPKKLFPKAGLEATFDFPDAGHILAETPMVMSDRICFAPRNNPGLGSWEENLVPLEEVPQIVFSEVMRDADLVVSVAALAGTPGSTREELLSEEAFRRRGELVTTLLEDIGLEGVSIDGRYVRIQGGLARYRVHLGSAAIHIEPTGYLCIVPARWGMREDVFLPFAHEDDPKVSEVISKVLLLLRDDEIKDKGIVDQIMRYRAG